MRFKKPSVTNPGNITATATEGSAPINCVDLTLSDSDDDHHTLAPNHPLHRLSGFKVPVLRITTSGHQLPHQDSTTLGCSRTHEPTIFFFFPPNFHKGIPSYVPTCALMEGDCARDQAENQLFGKRHLPEFHPGFFQLAKTRNYEVCQISAATRTISMDRPRTQLTSYYLNSDSLDTITIKQLLPKRLLLS